VETRLVPDAPGAWLVYDLGTLVFAVPPEFRAAADAIAATPPVDAGGVLEALRSSGAPAASFAVLDATAEGLHVALRGTATLAADVGTFTGLGVDPWLERVLPRTSVVRLTVPGGEWTLTLPDAVAAVPRGRRDADEVPHITEVPEVSLPAAPLAPPPLGLGEPGGLAPVAASPPGPTLSLELPDGTREPLDGVVVVGRAPTASRGSPNGRLLRLTGDGDVSRNHVQVAVEGGTVVVTDLGSRNGTIVHIPGFPARTLREGEPTPVLVGTTIDFGGGLELIVRGD
jgi:hypothetical protein